MNAPKLRFKSFKDNWIINDFATLFTIRSGHGFKASEYIAVGIPLIKIDNVGYGSIKSENVSYLPNDYIDKYPELLLREGDIVLALNRPITNNELKISYISPDFSPSILYQRVGKIDVVNKDSKLKAFAYQLLRRNIFKFVTENSVGSDQPFISTEKLKKYEMLIPSFEEQKKIGKFLSLFDRKIEKQKEKIEKLEELKKCMMQKIFSQKLRFKDEDGKEFGEWDSFLFKNVVSNKSDKVNPEDGSDLNMCIELENIESGSGRIIKNINYLDQTSMKNKFSRESVLFGKLRPYLKKFWFSDSEGMCSTEIWVLSTRVSNLKKKFLYYFIQTEYFMKYANMSSGSKMPRADWNIISNIEFMIPTIKEQQKISDFFSTLDYKIENEKYKIELLKNQKKGFMQQMFI